MTSAASPVSELPASVRWLGYGGLIPFVGLAALWLLEVGPRPLWLSALQAYGAAILSFVGALHWAFAMLLPTLTPRRRQYLFLWSTIPALLAWVAWLLPAAIGLWLLAGGFVAHLAHDQALTHEARLPAWYLPLRLRLTAGAVSSLLAVAVAQMWT